MKTSEATIRELAKAAGHTQELTDKQVQEIDDRLAARYIDDILAAKDPTK